MIVHIKYFYENTPEDYEAYNILWQENSHRIVYLPVQLTPLKQLHCLREEISASKDILAVRYPPPNFIEKNKIIQRLLQNNGILYGSNNLVWIPSEVWVYDVPKCQH